MDIYNMIFNERWNGYWISDTNRPLGRPGIYMLIRVTEKDATQARILSPARMYIGLARDMLTRILQHTPTASGTGRKFQKALAKYGRSGFALVPIYYLTSTDDPKQGRKHLFDIESQLINSFDSINTGYNVILWDMRRNKYLGEEFSKTLVDSFTIERRNRISRRNKLSQWITDGFEERRLPHLNDLPEGWSVGRLENKAAKSVRASTMRRPDVRAKLSAAFEGRIWITDGVDAKQIFPEEAIPDGWRRGRAGNSKLYGRVGITNGVETRFVARGTALPSGWRPGRTNPSTPPKMVNVIKITNGNTNRVIPVGSEIPPGYYRGQTTKRRSG